MHRLLMICGLLYSLQVAGGGLPPPAREMGVLEQTHPILRFSAKELDRSAGDKFLLFDIVSVVNPNTIPLVLAVHYQKPGQNRLYLGSFALYPADNPGRFIVATQGRVDNEGEVMLTLLPMEQAEGAQSVKVRLQKVRLINQLEPNDHGF